MAGSGGDDDDDGDDYEDNDKDGSERCGGYVDVGNEIRFDAMEIGTLIIAKLKLYIWKILQVSLRLPKGVL